MSRFFIDRPIFAWVVALFIIVAGIVCIPLLPVAQYPQVAPPSITLTVSYPGADAQTIEETVLSRIEREMNGLENLDYMEAKSLSNGTGTLTLTFYSGTNDDIAQMNVQNKLSSVEPRLPAMVRQTGVAISKSRTNFLLLAMFTTNSPSLTTQQMADYVARNVQPELQRVNGVGNAQLFGAERAIRIWLDADKLRSLNLSPADVNNAVAAQNQQVSAGSLGALPISGNITNTATIVVPGQLKTVEQFEQIVLKSNIDGSLVRLKDVAKVELGSQDYATSAHLDGKDVVGMGIQLTTKGNALETAKAVKAKLKELQQFFPAGMTWTVPYDSSTFVSISIEKVVHTLVEAIVLVFFVMLLFLQNIRYTLVPTIVVPIALLGALVVMYFAGLSINVLTMFAMVLVIGIVVDDAIVVVENVERIMAEEKLPPKEATKKAMGEISGAVIGITLVLIAVFIPMAFFPGSTGKIYRQFSLVMSVAIFFSAFLALSLTPALCATMLKPITEHDEKKKGFFGWFNRKFTSTTKKYESKVAYLLHRGKRMIVLYLVIAGAALFVMTRLPSSFLPVEDQGYAISLIQLPPGATQERTLSTVRTMENFAMKQPEVQHVVSVLGFSPTGQGQNMGMSFVTLQDWAKRTGKGEDAASLSNRLTGAMMAAVKDGYIFTLTPPAIPELGTSNGFSFRLQDRGGKGHEALLAARNQLIGMARQSKVLAQVRPDGMEDEPQLRIDIDRDAANAQGVSFDAIASVLSTMLGSNYVNDFPNNGRMQRVIVQSDAASRMTQSDLNRLTVNNKAGQPVPLASMMQLHWITGPAQTIRYNGYPAMALTGSAAPGYSSGDAMAEIQKLAAKLPDGFGYEWTGLSKEEQDAGNQNVILYAFSLLAVFLCLAALYESWSIPLSVLLVVPLGLLGVVLGTWSRGMENDVFFQVGLITVIGLSAKNAILIVEFAKDLQKQGKSPLEAALAAAHLRFRPILMTSMAFIMGVIPLYFASGASAASQRAIGTSVLWGMLIGTALAVFFVPLFYSGVRSLFMKKNKQQDQQAHLPIPASEAVITQHPDAQHDSRSNPQRNDQADKEDKE